MEGRGFKWLGHLLRISTSKWPKQLFEWIPPGKRKRGRLRKSWNKRVRKAIKKTKYELGYGIG